VIVLGLSALLLRQPTLLLFVALLALIFPLPVVLLLRPISLRFDGADLIYQFGGRETRVGGKDVARCGQVRGLARYSGSDRGRRGGIATGTYIPRYAFRTSSDASSSLPVPVFTIDPVSRT